MYGTDDTGGHRHDKFGTAMYPANTGYWPSVGEMLVYRLRRWANTTSMSRVCRLQPDWQCE